MDFPLEILVSDFASRVISPWQQLFKNSSFTSDLRAPMRTSHGRSCLRNGIMLIQNEYDRFYLGNGIMLIRTEHITGGICFHHSDYSEDNTRAKGQAGYTTYILHET